MTVRMRGIYTAPVNESVTRPLGPYERRPVALQAWDPRVVAVAAEVTELIRSRRPDLHVEHIGSTAVPGLPGKGIVDLGTEAEAAEIPAITAAMYELGFGPQPGPDPWPPTRPMHVGSYRYDDTEFRIHFHVHPLGGDLDHDLAFRDALRADPALAKAYGRVKSEVLAGADGPLDGVIYQGAKGGWIIETYDRLGIPRPGPARSTVTEDSA